MEKKCLRQNYFGTQKLQRDWAGKCAIFQMACNSKSVQFLTMQLIRVCTSAQGSLASFRTF